VRVTRAEEKAEEELIETAWLRTLRAVDISNILDGFAARAQGRQKDLQETIRAILEEPGRHAGKLLETQRRERDEEVAKVPEPPIDPKN